MRSCVVLICLVALFSVSFAQTPQPAPTGPQTLRQQYATLKSDLDIINNFRMIRLYEMDQFWRIIEDSLKTKRATIHQGVVLAQQQAAEIEGLKAQIVKTESEKQELVLGVANISVLGMSFSKSGFVAFVTTVTIALLVLAGVLFVINRFAFKSARDSKRLSDEVYEEFEDYKHIAVEKNIKLSRELQSLKNRMAELKIA